MIRKPLLWASFLIAFTLLYNVFEGAASIMAGLRANSLTLVAFGSDSYLEVLAAGAVLWRLSFRDEEEGERAEERAMRVIGVTFLLLGAAIMFQAVLSLAEGRGAQESRFGIALLALSLTLMPILALAKLRLAARTRMPVLAAEAKETIACSYLSLTAFAGLIAIALVGWWWLDSVAALLMVPWLVREGTEGVKAEACFEGVVPCFCRSCLFGLRSCRAACCEPPGSGALQPT
jgi:divalent metal cation (Fe/Co/Zn/Cd) transporter